MSDTQRKPKSLAVGVYTPTVEFYNITEHIAVFDTSAESVARALAAGYTGGGGELVAVFGPSADENHAELVPSNIAQTKADAVAFHAYPDMLEALCYTRHLFVKFMIRGEKPTDEELQRFDEMTRAAIAKAEGGVPNV